MSSDGQDVNSDIHPRQANELYSIFGAVGAVFALLGLLLVVVGIFTADSRYLFLGLITIATVVLLCFPLAF